MLFLDIMSSHPALGSPPTSDMFFPHSGALQLFGDVQLRHLKGFFCMAKHNKRQLQWAIKCVPRLG